MHAHPPTHPLTCIRHSPQHLRTNKLKKTGAAASAVAPGGWASGDTHNQNENKLEGLLASLLAGGVRGGGVPRPGQEVVVASGLRFVRPVDEHMSLNEVPVTPLLVRGWGSKVLLLLGGRWCWCCGCC